MSPIALIDAGTAWPPVAQHPELAGRVEPIDLYDLDRSDLSGYRALVFTGNADQRYLAARRGYVATFLDGGGTVVWCGQLRCGWLPGTGAFQPIERPRLADYYVHVVTDHPVFAGVAEDDLTFRRGVAGFFARGSHPLPPGATVLTELACGHPSTYVDTMTTRGTLLVHAGQEFLGYLDEENTAARLPRQLLAWLDNEGAER